VFLPVAIRAEDDTSLEFGFDLVSRTAVRDEFGDGRSLVVDMVEHQAARITLRTARTASGRFVLVQPRPKVLAFLVPSVPVVFHPVTVGTENLAFRHFFAETLPTVSVRDHLRHRHLFRLLVGMVKVETRRVGLTTDQTTPLSLAVVGLRPEACPPCERAFGVPLDVPVVPALVDRQFFPLHPVRECDAVWFWLHSRSSHPRHG
jgi:hypothetical protein